MIILVCAAALRGHWNTENSEKICLLLVGWQRVFESNMLLEVKTKVEKVKI
jgi:hypothetical protein